MWMSLLRIQPLVPLENLLAVEVGEALLFVLP
jgi:hypothetical protein